MNILARIRAWWNWPKFYEAKAKCWLVGHDWNHVGFMCERCAVNMTDAADQAGRTLPEHWHQFVRRLRTLFAPSTGYVPGSNPREDRQRRTWRNWYLTIAGTRWGFQYAPLFINDRPYMTRWILYLGPINLRVHQFFRGDDDRAPHNHPWWFITFPFSTYVEAGFEKGHYIGTRFVKRFRFHRRAASFEHIVLGRAVTQGGKAWTYRGAPLVEKHGAPFWTFVIAGSKAGDWGFYPEPGRFVPWWEFKP